MYFLLTLFFVSLFSITFMIARKLVLIQSGQLLHLHKAEVRLESSHIEEWRNVAVKNIKRYGYIVLVAIIRAYVQLSNFLKDIYQELKNKIKNIIRDNENGSEGVREVNGFLKMISEYKYKIRAIKQKVREEENLPE